ncbi:MAG TPA: ABC transporter substrate-binding protein [Nitrosopumilaceae archaeon]|nr:ABC transporter substrate-binding protein [Nitrosopumilaceae archaeon]
MKIRSAVTIGIFGLLLIVTLSVFFQSTQSEPANKVRIAFFPTVNHLVPIVAIEKGFFAGELGTELFLDSKIFDSGPQVIEAMFAKSIDIAYVGPGPVINGFLKSETRELKILAGAASGGASFVIHPNSKINSAEDLPGKKIAAPQIGNSQDVSLRNYLSQNGLLPAEKGGSVIVLNLENPDIYTLFVKGDIDAAWVPEPWATRLVHELGGKRLFFEEDLWPEKKFTSALLIARTAYIEENPIIIQKLIDANNKTVNWINENPDDSELIFNQFIEKELGKPFPPDVVSKSLENIAITSDPIEESIFIFAERANTLGYLGRNGYDLDGIFYNTIYKDVMS